MDKTKLVKLAERIEAGDNDANAIYVALDKEDPRYLFWLLAALYKQSLDAAKALHDAVLPGWYFHIHTGGSYTAMVAKWHEDYEYKGFASTPAAAWVAAILRAKAKETE